MKNLSKIILLFSIFIIFQINVFSQKQNDNKGKAFYTVEEVNQRCGIPIDSYLRKMLKAKQDSMYKDYLSKKKLHKITSEQNWTPLMGDVDNQGSCSNCWAYAATGLVEGQIQILYGSTIGEKIDLNETDIAEYYNPSNPCLGGYISNALSYIKTYKAISEVGNYPNLEGVRWDIVNYNSISGITAIENALANGPVAAAFQVYEDFGPFFNSNPTGVYHYDGISAEDDGHGVVIVGYNDVNQYWICKNSWGSNWGDGGYFKIGYGECLIESWSNYTATVNSSCFAKISPSLISSLSTALNNGFANNEWAYAQSGTTTMTSNSDIPSTAKLIAETGSTINLNNYFLTLTGGTIVQESGSTITGLNAYLKYYSTLKGFFPTIQSAVNEAGYQYTVELLSQTYNESFSIVNKYRRYLVGASSGNTIINGNITITNSSYSSVSDLSMANGKTITINGGTQSKLSNITSTSGSSAINVYDGLGTEISNSNYISNEAQAPAWSFYNTNSGGLMSDVIEGYMFGIYANSGSDISLNAPLFCNNMIDLYANGSTTSIYAREYVLSYEGATIGDVTLVDMYGTGVCGGGGIFKSNISQNEQVVNDDLRDANSAFRALLMDEDISKSFTLTKESKSKIKAVIAKYKNVLLINLSKGEINEVLRKLSACYKMLDEVTVFADYVSSLVSNNSVSKEMKRFLIPSMVGKGNYNDAINLINEILTYKDISLDLEYELLYEKGTIQKNYLEEKALSEEVFLNLYRNAGDHILGQYAKAQLENQSSLDDGNKEIDGDNSDISENFEISSYPNPFNPTTTIAYQIPKDGFVNLVVYNTLGQVITELVNEHQTSGKYSVQFNASNLPSGVYFYKIESGSFTKVNKMLLLR